MTLAMIDDAWKNHLRAMDDLRTSVRMASYEQKDPLLIYKIEAFNLFNHSNLNHKHHSFDDSDNRYVIDDHYSDFNGYFNHSECNRHIYHHNFS